MRSWLVVLGAALLVAGTAAAQARGFIHVFHRTQTGVSPGAAAHVLGYTTATIHVGATGTPSFNVHFLASLDGTSWTLYHCQSTARLTGHRSVAMHTVLGTGLWRCDVAGLAYLAAHITAYTGGGSVTVIGTLVQLPFRLPRPEE